MKPSTVFLGEMTNPEVEAFLKAHHTVIIPTGATEQHGPHAPLLTDVLIPNEIARRIAPKVGAVVAPPINYTLSYPHVGFTGLVHIRIPTFMALIEDLCVAFANSGFKRIVFLNGHYDNTYAIAYACANAADKIGKDVKAFPVNYWDALTAEEVDEFSGLKNGLHANLAETSAVMAINPDLVDLERANAEFPPFPKYTIPTGPVHTAFFFTAPGSVYWATKSGTWGDPRKSTPEAGERYLEAGVRSTLALLENKAEGKPNGMNHFGFHVDDQEEIARRLTKAGAKAPAKRPADRPYAETRATDPDGNNFDISVAGFGSEEGADTKKKESAVA